MSDLPPGQQEHADFPRFGLTPYASRFPRSFDPVTVTVQGDVENSCDIFKDISTLERVFQTSDFHCVTTWSVRNLTWSGYRFADVYEQIIKPQTRPDANAGKLVFRSQDGYRTALPLEDALAPDVLLADRLNDKPLCVAHGAPVRLIAPAHYGYKNVKHLKSIEFRPKDYAYRPAMFRFMDHPRARVAHEERGTTFPGWLLRRLYRPLIGRTQRTFRDELERYRQRTADRA